MPVYGSFETVREVSRSGLGAVYTARRVGSTDERFAIKLFRPPASLGMEDDEIERDSRFFINAAEVQKSLGRAGSAWAPIYETGRMEGGAWYATDLFDRSIERLLLNRPDLEPADLLRVVDAVVSGLFELREATGRAHGNLKTSNVLLSGKGDVSAARVVLCDPWAAERLRGGEAREDLRGLGDLIHWLVLHRGVRRPTGWPVQVSPEWKRLGRVGDGWLSLTNKLLDPTDDKLTLDEVPGLVPGGKVRPGSSTTALPTPVSRASRESKPESKPESKAELFKGEPPKSAPPQSEPAKPEPPRSEPRQSEPARVEPSRPEVVKSEPLKSEPAKVEPARAEPPKVESSPVRPASSPAVVTPVSPPATPAAVDADVTQDLPSHGSGAGVGSGSGVGSGVGVVASGSREAVPAGAGGAGSPGPATMSRAPSMTSVGRVSTASMASAPKSFEELEAESRRRQAEPKKTSNAKWIGIGVGAVALVAVAAVVISNLGGGNKDKPGENKNGAEPIALNDPSKKDEPKETPKVDPPKVNDQGKPENADADTQAEEARKREEDRIKTEAADRAAADKAAADKAAADKAAKDEAGRKAKEAADKAAADKAAADKAAKDEADRKAKEAADKAAADKTAADSAKAAKVNGVRALVQKIAGHLSLGLGFKDLAPDGGESIEELLKQIDVSVEKEAVAGDAALTDALARARGLAEIAAIADAPVAAKRAADEAGRGRASEALAAATRAMSLFKDPAAGDLDALEASGKFLEGVRDSVGKLPNGVAARRDAIVKAANDRRRAMFLAGVGKVAIDDAAMLRRAAGLATGFGVKPEELPVKARLNLLTLALKEELAKAADDAAATAAVSTFKNAAGALGAEVAPAVAAIVTGLDAAAKTPDAPREPVLDFAKVGPMSTGSGWSLDAAHPAAGDFSSVTYRSPSGQSVQFIRLTGTNTYLAATETTVGVFADAVKTQPTLLDQALLVKKEQLKGVFSWERAGRDIVSSKGGAGDGADPYGWLATHIALQNAGIPPYPAGLEAAVGQPSVRHPMQQVTAPTAQLAAAAIGCRLPSEAEWSAAMAMAGTGERPNVRDASWKRYQDYLKDVGEGRVPPKAGRSAPPREQLPWPDQGTFSPQEVIPNKWNAEAVEPGDDGAVWFRPAADPDGKFHDLVGNVAEWLQPPASAPARERYLIGGSALSPSQIAPTTAQRRRILDTVAYADVGFRLAFDAAGGTAPGPEPLAVRLKKAADAIVLTK